YKKPIHKFILMLLIFGIRGIKHSINDSPVLHNSCPNCNEGNLISKLYRRWFSLFFIPVIPLNVIDRFYDCDKCSSVYNEQIKTLLQQAKAEVENAQKEAKRIYGKALIASMTHMSIIDGDFAPQEEREIMDAIKNHSDCETVLMDIFENVKENGNKDNQVFNF